MSGRSPARPRRSAWRGRAHWHQERRGRAHWRAWFPLLAVLGLLLLAPALVHAQGAAPDSVTLRWTAVGDDSLSGTAAAYDLRMADAPITESSWSAATALSGLPAPLASGTAQQVTVRGLTAGSTYYFALRVRDDAGNWSGVSNVVRWDGVLDTSPPAAPSGLVSELRGNGVHLAWTPSGAPDLAGYSVYRATASAGPFTKLNLDLLTPAEYQDDALPPGATSLWYQVTASDMSGNESARSASVPGVPIAESPALAWPPTAPAAPASPCLRRGVACARLAHRAGLPEPEPRGRAGAHPRGPRGRGQRARGHRGCGRAPGAPARSAGARAGTGTRRSHGTARTTRGARSRRGPTGPGSSRAMCGAASAW